MRFSISFITLFQFFILQSCVVKENGDAGQSWLNIKYIECLKNSLPCDCEKITETYYSLVLETNGNSKNFGIALSKFEQMEPYLYPIKEIGFNEYTILKSQKDTSSWAKLVIKGEELQFIEDNLLSKFAKSKKSKGYNVQHYLVDNVNLLNESFVARKYPKLEKIVKEDSLRCDCNKWMGNVNLLSVKGAPRHWIMEIKSDSLQIYKITNVNADPDDSVETKKIIGYKWR